MRKGGWKNKDSLETGLDNEERKGKRERKEGKTNKMDKKI